jgi:CRISPR/Cas system-associated endoribonuclease Cas2
MLTHRLVRLIETHSEALASSLLQKVQNSKFTTSFQNVPPDELKQRVAEIYLHLGEWLVAKTDAALERRYREIGARRYHQHVPVSELVWAIILAKQTLWEFLAWESVPDRLAEVFGELELLQLLGGFFDRAVHYAVQGYEEACALEHEDAAIGVASR